MEAKKEDKTEEKKQGDMWRCPKCEVVYELDKVTTCKRCLFDLNECDDTTLNSLL